VQIYLARVAAERDSQRQLNDSTADARRAAAPDPRPQLLAPVS
jgi:glycerol-3-phosphate dehydrogenase